jgi:G:T-mismatch repair DNA endonuclease (very short patch repair protein)
MYKLWSKEEKNFLIFLYMEKGLCLSEIYPLFKESKFDRTETAIKIKIKKLKLKHTNEQISKIKSRIFSGEKNGMYGKESVNLGLTKENSNRILKSSLKISKTRKEMFKNGELDVSGEKNGMYGKESWNKGKTKYTDEKVRKMSEKISIHRKKWWIELSDEEKEKIITNLSRASLRARKDTKIEMIIKEVLEKMDINFIRNYKKSKFFFDFYLIDYNFVIECQGDYWHGNREFFENLNHIQLKNVERDNKKKKYLQNNNISFLFIWENEIYKNKENLNNIIWQHLKKKQK